MRLNAPYYPFIPKPPIAQTYRNKSFYSNYKINEVKKVVPQCETTSNSSFIDIFGIKLEFDDFLILGLLFFLFMEGVDDKLLYIFLFTLLLS